MGVKPRFVFSLGCHSKKVGNERVHCLTGFFQMGGLCWLLEASAE
jgi:hypothetical protein